MRFKNVKFIAQLEKFTKNDEAKNAAFLKIFATLVGRKSDLLLTIKSEETWQSLEHSGGCETLYIHHRYDVYRHSCIAHPRLSGIMLPQFLMPKALETAKRYAVKLLNEQYAIK